jgi:hypothetical protein
METDVVKFKEFLKVLSKERLVKFSDDLGNHSYSLDLFVDYDDYNGGFLIQFENENINNAFKEFDEAFCDFKNYLFKISHPTYSEEEPKKSFASFENGGRELWELWDVLKREYMIFLNIAGKELQESGPKDNKKSLSGPIKEVICVEPKIAEANNAKLIINGVYENPILIDLNKKWQILFEIAKDKEQSIPFEKGYEDFLEYINGNGRCAIYANTNYDKTKILENDHGQVVSRIKLDIISDKIFMNRFKKETEK